MAKSVFRVTVSTTLLVLNVVRSIGYVATGVFRIDDLVLVGAAVVPVVLGTWAGERLHHSPGRYVLVNDFVFAESWDDIIAGNILHPLFVDEHGEERDDLVWTDTASDGSALLPAGGDHCNDWEDDSPESLAHYGYSWEVDGDWTRFDDDPGFNPISCDTWGALYCFESP